MYTKSLVSHETTSLQNQQETVYFYSISKTLCNITIVSTLNKKCAHSVKPHMHSLMETQNIMQQYDQICWRTTSLKL